MSYRLRILCRCSAQLSETPSTPEFEHRVRRSNRGLEIQTWRLISTTLLPDQPPLMSAPAEHSESPSHGAIVSSIRHDDPTIEIVAPGSPL